MKFAVISDVHFGDPDCILVERSGPGWRLRDDVKSKLEWILDLDVLVLLGDVLDFSIDAYEDAFAAAMPFFDWLSSETKSRRNVGKRCIQHIVYNPGNHDAMMWHVLEYDTRITRPLGDGAQRVARPLRSALPCLIDTTKTSDWVSLPNVSKPGDIFLTGFFGINTFVAYPNVYIRLPDETMLLTHGHHLETYWAILGELSQKLGKDDDRTHPKLNIPPIAEPPTLKQLVDFNHPLVSLACMGIGQAGDLTLRARQIQREGKHTPITNAMLLDKYLKRFRDWVGDQLHQPDPPKPTSTWKYPAYWKDCAEVALKNKAIAAGLDYGFSYLRKQIDGIEPARVSAANRAPSSWLTYPDVMARFVRYLDAANHEAADVLSISPPTSVVFGHTHRHEDWPTIVPVGTKTMKSCNTGGWLTANEAYALVGDGSLSLKKAI